MSDTMRIVELAYSALRIVALLLALTSLWLVASLAVPASRSAEAARPRPFMKGDPIGPVEGLDLSQSDRTLIIAIRRDCYGCSYDLPFYRRLLEKCQGVNATRKLRLVLVTPDAEDDARAWLAAESLNFSTAVFRVMPSPAFRVLTLPALILTDRSALVRAGWVGERTPEEEEMILTGLCK